MTSYYIIRNASGQFYSSAGWMKSQACARRFSRIKGVRAAISSLAPSDAPLQIVQIRIQEISETVAEIKSISNWSIENESGI